jgi:D-alanyl-D-alanine carboxypeptidase (penicillin-binding protein 5/6)
VARSLGVHPALPATVLLSIGAALGLGAEPALAAPPRIQARAAVLVDVRDDHVLYGRHARQRRPIASTTKLMTALLTLEHLPLGRRLAAVPYRAGPAESLIDLRPGEHMAVSDLLWALLLESANDAAATLAQREAGSSRRFVRQMNARARRLGLRDTHYANPIGLDEPGNYSSALDLSKLASRLLRDDTFATIVDSSRARLQTGSRPRVVQNRNDLVERVPWIDGVKTGHTAAAGYVLVGAGTRKGVMLVSVVLGEPSQSARDSDTLGLLEYGFSRYRRVRIVGSRQRLAHARVDLFGGRQVGLVARQGAAITVRRGQRLRTEARVPAEVEGPLRRGSQVGELRVFRGARLVRLVPVVVAEAVPAPGLLRKLERDLPWIFLGVVVAAAGLRVAWRRRVGAGR